MTIRTNLYRDVQIIEEWQRVYELANSVKAPVVKTCSGNCYSFKGHFSGEEQIWAIDDFRAAIENLKRFGGRRERFTVSTRKHLIL